LSYPRRAANNRYIAIKATAVDKHQVAVVLSPFAELADFQGRLNCFDPFVIEPTVDPGLVRVATVMQDNV